MMMEDSVLTAPQAVGQVPPPVAHMKEDVRVTLSHGGSRHGGNTDNFHESESISDPESTPESCSLAVVAFKPK